MNTKFADMKSHIRVMNLTPEQRRMFTATLDRRFAEIAESTWEEPDHMKVLTDAKTREQKVNALCDFIRNMPEAFWGENGPVQFDRKLWRKADEIAKSLRKK